MITCVLLAALLMVYFDEKLANWLADRELELMKELKRD